MSRYGVFIVPVASGLFLFALAWGFGLLFPHPLYRPNYVHAVASVIFVSLTWGVVAVRANRGRVAHARLLFWTVMLDLLLTAWHEIGLRAISVITESGQGVFQGDRTLLWVHIVISGLLVILYPFTLVGGSEWLHPNKEWAKKHRIPGVVVWMSTLPERHGLVGKIFGFSTANHEFFGYGVLVLNFLSWLTAPYFLGQWLLLAIRG